MRTHDIEIVLLIAREILWKILRSEEVEDNDIDEELEGMEGEVVLASYVDGRGEYCGGITGVEPRAVDDK